MLQFIIIFLFLFCFILINNRIKDQLSKTIILLFLIYSWGSLLISSYKPYDYYEIGGYTYFLLFLGFFCFFIGFCSKRSSINNYTKVNLSHIFSLMDKILSSKKLSIFCLILFVYFLPYVSKTLIYSQLGEEISTLWHEIFTPLSFNIFQYIIQPLFVIACCLIPFALLKFKSKYILSLISLSSIVFLKGVFQGSKALSLTLFVSFCLMIIILEPLKIKKIISKYIVILTVLFCISFYVMMMMANYRTSGEFKVNKKDLEEQSEEMSKSMVKYAILPFQLFDISIEKNYFEKYEGPLWGRATFAGLEQIIVGGINKLGGNLSSTRAMQDDLQNDWQAISPTEDRNYAYTAIYYHYLDFGIIGVIIFPFFFGWIYRYVLLSFYKNPTFPLIVMIIWGFQSMQQSLFTCNFAIPYACVFSIILIIWHMCNKKY